MRAETKQIKVLKPLADGKAPAARRPAMPALARDVAMMGSGMALAALFNTLLVFLIPKLVNVENFGYWRLFLLYGSYAGLLHFGFADGALLRWAGRPPEDFREEIWPSLKFLFWQQLMFILPLGLLAVMMLPSPLNLIGIAILLLALILNVGTVLQYSLQGSRQFKPVAIATAAPPGVFVVLAFLWHLHYATNFQELIAFYLISWAGVLAYLWACVRPQHSPESVWRLGKTCIALGWPIVVANGGSGFVQSADRLVVSATLPIYDFAQYSLAASAMFVPIAAIVAVSRVFFSHVAAVEPEGRARVYAQASNLVVLAWSLLLPYYFGLELFVRNFLPQYIPGLPIAAVLLLGAVFLAGIQILHTSYSYLYGRQRQFLRTTVAAFIVSSGVAVAMAAWLKSLLAVAAGQVAALGLWWTVNEWNLRHISGQTRQQWLRVWAVFLFSSASFGVALWSGPRIGWRVLTYCFLAIPVLFGFCRQEFRLGWRLIGTSNS